MEEPKRPKRRARLPSWAVWSLVIWAAFLWLVMIVALEDSERHGGGSAAKILLLIFSPVFLTTLFVDIYRLYTWLAKK